MRPPSPPPDDRRPLVERLLDHSVGDAQDVQHERALDELHIEELVGPDGQVHARSLRKVRVRELPSRLPWWRRTRRDPARERMPRAGRPSGSRRLWEGLLPSIIGVQAVAIAALVGIALGQSLLGSALVGYVLGTAVITCIVWLSDD